MRLTMPRHTYVRMHTYPLVSKQLLTLSYSSHGHPRPFKRRRGPDHKQTRIKLADPLQLQSFRPECFQVVTSVLLQKTKSCFSDSSLCYFEYRANRGWNLLHMFQFPYDMLCTFISRSISPAFFAFSYRWLHLELAGDHLFQCNFLSLDISLLTCLHFLAFIPLNILISWDISPAIFGIFLHSSP